jgi:hypothetical protein
MSALEALVLAGKGLNAFSVLLINRQDDQLDVFVSLTPN